MRQSTIKALTDESSKITENPVELVPISQLTIHPFLENLYKLGNFDSLEQSMKDQGQLHEIFHDVNNRVLSGARRLVVAKRLKWTHIKARRVDADDEASLQQLIIAFNQLRKKSFKEEIAEAKYVLGIIGVQQGKKRELLLDETDPQFNTIKSDRYAIAAKYCGLDKSGNTLRKAVCIDDFENLYPDNGLNLTDSVERGIMSVERAYKLAKQYPEVKQELAEIDIPKADGKYLVEAPPRWEIFHQSCIEMMQLANGSVNGIYESLPYFQLRDYRSKEERDAATAAGDTSELGQEATVEEFIENLKPYYRERFRVLHPEGSMFINIGDTYSREKNNLVSQRLVLMLCIELGFHLVNEIVFHVSSKLPQAIDKRLQPSYEKVFHFVKSTNYKYYPFALEDVTKKIATYKIDRPNKRGTIDRGNYCLSKPYKKFKDFITLQDQDDILKHCNVQGESVELSKLCPEIKHPAPYSTSLMLLPILTTTQPDDLILDGFGGSGSTIITAVLMGRKAVMYEKQERFVELAKKRISLTAKDYNDKTANMIENLATGKTIDISDYNQSSIRTTRQNINEEAA